MIARLPTPGGDDGDWGDILNTFLEVSHNGDGTLSSGAVQQVGASVIDANVSDIQALGTQSAGSTGKAADAGHIHPTTGLTKLSGATFTGYVAPGVVNLIFGATININASLGNVFAVTLTSSAGTIANPTNPVDGQLLRLRIIQDATGTRTVSWGNSFDFGSTNGSANSTPTLTITPSKTDVLAFEYYAAISKWIYLGTAFPQGF